MDFVTWFRGWLSRHPLKEPDPSQRLRFTAEVMERIRTVSQPETARARSSWSLPRWFTWPGLALAAAAGLAVVLILPRFSHQQLARQPLEPTPLVMAEAPSDDEQWLEQTLLLLDDLDESAGSDSSEDDQEQWLEELERLEREEIATRS